MNAPTLARVLGDIHDGAVTIRLNSMLIPSDITDGNLYRGIVWDLIGDGLAVHNRTTGDVAPTGQGMAVLAAEAVTA